MAGRGGLFGRAVRAIQRVFAQPKPPRPEPSRESPGPREGRDRQRARERNPYLRWWDRETRGEGRTGYLAHKDFIDDMAAEYNLDEEDKQEIWRDYVHYLVSSKSHYLRNDIHNPFWAKWGVDPDYFDWHAWREAMGYPHGVRRS